MPGERVIFQRVLHLRSQAVEATTHICDASDDPDFGTGRQRYHRIPPFISRMSTLRSSGVRGANSFTTPDLRCSSHCGESTVVSFWLSSDLFRQKGFVTGLTGSGVSVIATGTAWHSWSSSSFSKPSSYSLFQLNNRLSLILCSLAIRATTAPGCNACFTSLILNSRL